MSEQIDAIYDNGVLRPLVPLAWPDKARVKVTVEAAPAREADERITGPKAAVREKTADGDMLATNFDRELERLLFDGPSLPADFSRADIYADHD